MEADPDALEERVDQEQAVDGEEGQEQQPRGLGLAEASAAGADRLIGHRHISPQIRFVLVLKLLAMFFSKNQVRLWKHMSDTENERPARITMKDIAARAGVSQSTVSFVLNGMDGMRIGSETRKRVLDAVSELGYRPRSAGRPSKAANHRVIGLMIDEVATSPFASISIEGAQEYAWRSNVLVEVVMTGGDKAYESAVLRKWAADRVEGVIYGSILTRQVTPPDALSKHRAVLLNCYDSDERFRVRRSRRTPRRRSRDERPDRCRASPHRVHFGRAVDGSLRPADGRLRAGAAGRPAFLSIPHSSSRATSSRAGAAPRHFN